MNRHPMQRVPDYVLAALRLAEWMYEHARFVEFRSLLAATTAWASGGALDEATDSLLRRAPERLAVASAISPTVERG